MLFSPSGLVGVWQSLRKRWVILPDESAAMSNRNIYEGLSLPGFLRPKATTGTALEVAGVSKYFSGIRAVTGASLQLGAGKIHALIGPNGAGKTTLFNIVSNLYPPSQGTVRLHGRGIHGLPVLDVFQNSLARSFQITSLFCALTIYENIRQSLQARHPGRFNIWREPFEGLWPAIVLEVFKVFDAPRKEIPIVIVKHNLDLVLALADRAFALERCAVIHQGPAKPLMDDLEYRAKILWI